MAHAVLVVLFWAVMLSAARYAAGTVQTIALSGTNPAGDAATFQYFSLPSLNNRGQVAFAAQLIGSEITLNNDTGYWIADHGVYHPVLREGAAAPGLPAGSVFGGVSSMYVGVPLNDAGDMAVGISATQTSGLWAGNQGSLTLLAEQGVAAPGAENSAGFGWLSGIRATLNRNGDVAFAASLNAAPYTTINSNSYDDGLWVFNRNGPVASALAGSSLLEIGPEAFVYGFRRSTYPGLNRNAEVIASGYFRVSPAATSANSYIGIISDAGLDVRGYYGQSLPEIGPNAKLSYMTPGGISATGAIVAQAGYSNTGSTPASGSAIVVAGSAGLELVAYSGSPVPGISGHVFTGFSYEPTINSRGEVAFYGNEKDGMNIVRSGVWAGPPDDVRLVLAQGMAAPGTNATFYGFIRNTPAINRFGQIAVPATLIEPGVASTESLWATDLKGNLVMIARVGDMLEVTPGDFHTITYLSMLTFHGDDDGKPRGLNDRGQVVFSAIFSDGLRGVFLSNAVAHLPGDYDGNGTVDTGDFVKWRRAMVIQDLAADGTRDGVVDTLDYELWREFYGQSLDAAGVGDGANSAVVPEPGVWVGVLVLSALFALLGNVTRGNRGSSIE